MFVLNILIAIELPVAFANKVYELNSEPIDTIGASQEAPTLQEVVKILAQRFATFEQQLVSLPPQQRLDAIYQLQQYSLQFLLQFPADQQVVAVQELRQAMSPQLAQLVFSPLIGQPQLDAPASAASEQPSGEEEDDDGLIEICIRSGYSQSFCRDIITGPPVPKLCPRFGVMLPC